MADFSVCNNILIDFNSHNIKENNEVYKYYGKWIEVRHLKVGDEIAVPDYETNTIRWEKIVSIKTLEPQHVYDLAIEDTRNFIANDIVAHNTYLGNLVLGADSIRTNNITSKTGNISLYSGLGTEVLKIDGENNRVGIGTATPGSNLDVSGNLSVSGSTNSSIDGSTLFIDATGNNVGIGTTVPSVKFEVNGGDTRLGGYLQMKDFDTGSWDGATNGSTIISRDYTTMFWHGGVALGQFADGALPSAYKNRGALIAKKDVALATESGNVGIGTTGPTAKLEINATIGTAAFNIHNDTGSSKFFVNATSSRVGIGTTTPTHTLTVSGDLNVTGFSITDDSLVTVVEFVDDNGNVINYEDKFNNENDNYNNNKKSINNELTNYEDNNYNNNNKGYRIEPNKLTPDNNNNNNNNYYNNENKNGLYYDNNINKPINAIYNNKDNYGNNDETDENKNGLYYDNNINAIYDNNDNNKNSLNYKIKKVKIKDIKAGDYVLSLDEKTGKLVPRKVNALLDHGIKPIYEMVTEDGRAINTTAEHPYLVKLYDKNKCNELAGNVWNPANYDEFNEKGYCTRWVEVRDLHPGMEIAVPKLKDYSFNSNYFSSSSSSSDSSSLSSFASSLASNPNKSLVENTLILSCCLNAGSSLQIGRLFNNKDKAKYGSSLVSSPCGESLLASLRNSSYLSSDINSISSSIVESVNSNSPKEFLEKCIILSFSDLNSSKMKYGEISLQPRFSNSSTTCLLVESFLKNENNILASTINSLGKIDIFYQPCLLAALSFALDDNSSICASVNSDLDMISSNIENLSLLINCLTTLSKADSNLLVNSDGTSNLIIISSMFLDTNKDYINLLDELHCCICGCWLIGKAF